MYADDIYIGRTVVNEIYSCDQLSALSKSKRKFYRIYHDIVN